MKFILWLMNQPELWRDLQQAYLEQMIAEEEE